MSSFEQVLMSEKAPSEKRARRARQSGFSLLEVIVATAIVGLVFVAMMEIFSSGLRTEGQADEYAIATQQATRLMNELYVNTRQNQPYQSSGYLEDGTHWQAAAIPLFSPGETPDSVKNLGIQRMLLNVEVTWKSRGSDRHLQIQTIKNVLKGSSKS